MESARNDCYRQTDKETLAMIIANTFLWLACSFGLCLFGFFVGRCARRLPIIDSRLPWTLSRGQIMRACEKEQEMSAHRQGKPSWPHNPY
jgi:hypothetical protein